MNFTVSRKKAQEVALQLKLTLFVYTFILKSPVDGWNAESSHLFLLNHI